MPERRRISAYEDARSPSKPVRRFRTSTKEIIHIIVATAALSVALYILFERQSDEGASLLDFDFTALDLFGRILLAVSVAFSGFVLHELGHKLVAQKFGHWSEFRASWFGLAIGIASAYFLGLVLALPGATWHTAESKSENGKVSAVGPLVNIFVMLAAVPIALGATGADLLTRNIAGAVAIFNAILAVFNLIPLGPLDGRKVIVWNPLFYLVLAALAVGGLVWTFTNFLPEAFLPQR